jgi:ribonuclease HII
MLAAHCQYEKSLWSQNKKYIVGIDEVGRGAWAGPMIIGAVILPPDIEPPFQLADSKLCTEKRRNIITPKIYEYALSTAIFEVPIEYINQYGIGKSGQYGFYSVLQKLSIQPDHILIDAFKIKEVPAEKQTAIIKGDQLSASIAAASIIAKVYRDKLMRALHLQAPEYSFDKNVGYGTKAHRDSILKNGLSKLHRKSFNLSKWLNPLRNNKQEN